MKKDLYNLAIHVGSIPYSLLILNITGIAMIVKFIATDILEIIDKLPDIKEKY